jgi:hypothetical protein
MLSSIEVDLNAQDDERSFLNYAEKRDKMKDLLMRYGFAASNPAKMKSSW